MLRVDPAELEVLPCGHESVYGLWEIAAGVNSAVPDLTVARDPYYTVTSTPAGIEEYYRLGASS